MPACTRPAADFTPEQLRFPPAAGYTIRGDFTGGEISSDLGALLLSVIIERVLGLLRQRWPHTHIVLRGDGHFANPELMELIVADGNADFIFGLGGNAVLSRKAEGLMRNARGHLALRRSLATQGVKI